MMRRSLTLFTTFLLLVSMGMNLGKTHLALAASPSPSPTVAPPSDSQTTQNLKERIDTVIKERATQVQETTTELLRTKRGFLGEIERVIDTNVTIKTTKTSEVVVVDDTVVVVRDGKKATLDDIAVGDWAIAIGFMQNDTFTLRRLVASSKTLRPKTYETLIGNAKKPEKTRLEVIQHDGQTKSFQLTKLTKYEDAQGTALKQTDLAEDTQYLVISYPEKDQQVATLIKSLAATK